MIVKEYQQKEMKKNKVSKIRAKLGYTQAQLAEKSNLSIRTIQRIESGKTIPKGHTLKVLAEALEVEKTELIEPTSLGEKSASEVNLKLKFINLASLFFIGVPFGNIIFPIWIWSKNRTHPQINEVGKRIINFQILWTLCTCFLLILSPFLQDFFPSSFTLILVVGLLAVVVNLFFIFKTAHSLMQHEYDVLPMKIRFL